MTALPQQLGILAPALSTDPREAARLARVANIDGLLFPAVSSALDLTSLSASGFREFRHLLSAQDRQLVGLRADLGPKGFGPGADVDRELNRLARAMEAAAGLQAPLVCVDLGPLPAPPAEPSAPKPRVTQEMAGLILLPTDVPVPDPAPTALRTPADEALESQLDAAMIELGKGADRYGVMLAFRSELSPIAAISRVVARSGCPWFGLDLDPVSMLADGIEMDACFSLVGSMVRHVRARDATVGAGRRTAAALLGRGSVQWNELLAKLDDAGYSGWVTIDPTDATDRPLAVRSALQVLRPALRGS